MHSHLGSEKLSVLKLGLAGLVLILVAWSCSTTEKSTEEPETAEKGPDKKAEEIDKPREQRAIKLASYRSDISDVYKSQRQTIPEAFAYRDTTQEVETNPEEGYRVQITATQKKSQAAAVVDTFRTWYSKQKYDSTMGYRPDSYTFFKPPYYRVQVGDFKDRTMAIGFAQLVKQKYPDAWIVHDRIRLNRVPADSLSTYLSKFR